MNGKLSLRVLTLLHLSVFGWLNWNFEPVIVHSSMLHLLMERGRSDEIKDWSLLFVIVNGSFMFDWVVHENDWMKEN